MNMLQKIEYNLGFYSYKTNAHQLDINYYISNAFNLYGDYDGTQINFNQKRYFKTLFAIFLSFFQSLIMIILVFSKNASLKYYFSEPKLTDDLVLQKKFNFCYCTI